MTTAPPLDFVERFARAMARQEGYYVTGSPAQRNRNPGNIRPWRGCKLPTANNLIVFPSVDAGWEQLRRQIRLNIRRGLTTREFFAGQRDKDGKVIPGGYAGYAPAADGNKPIEYAAFVAASVGIRPVPGPDGKVIEAIDRVLEDAMAEDARRKEPA